MGGMGGMRGNMGMGDENEVDHDDDVTALEEEDGGGGGVDVDDVLGDEEIVGEAEEDALGNGVFVCLSICPSVCLSVCLSFCLSVFIYVYTYTGREPVAVELEDCLAFERLGHIKLKALVRGEALTRLKDAVNRAFDESMLAAVVQKIRVLAVDAGDDDFLERGNRLRVLGSEFRVQGFGFGLG